MKTRAISNPLISIHTKNYQQIVLVRVRKTTGNNTDTYQLNRWNRHDFGSSFRTCQSQNHQNKVLVGLSKTMGETTRYMWARVKHKDTYPLKLRDVEMSTQYFILYAKERQLSALIANDRVEILKIWSWRSLRAEEQNYEVVKSIEIDEVEKSNVKKSLSAIDPVNGSHDFGNTKAAYPLQRQQLILNISTRVTGAHLKKLTHFDGSLKSPL